MPSSAGTLRTCPPHSLAWEAAITRHPGQRAAQSCARNAHAALPLPPALLLIRRVPPPLRAVPVRPIFLDTALNYIQV